MSDLDAFICSLITIIVEVTKNTAYVRSIPTQIYSFFVATLLVALFYPIDDSKLSKGGKAIKIIDKAVTIVDKAIELSLASCGIFCAFKRLGWW